MVLVMAQSLLLVGALCAEPMPDRVNWRNMGSNREWRRICRLMRCILLASLLFGVAVVAQEGKREFRYVEDGHARHVLDVYAPADAKDLPVVFWIHGGGWQSGDKANVQEKPAWFMEQGFVFVSINHRLLPEVKMEELVGDVAKAFGWMQKHISKHGEIRGGCWWAGIPRGRNWRL
jgi:hypothetical protein